jgi:NADH-quinone oxidoreductase subunit D
MSLFNIEHDRSKYPEKDKDGKPIIDLDSHKYVKLWQGPQHPGVTGNMAVEFILAGDEVVNAKTHVGYLHRGFEKLFEQRLFVQNLATCIRMCVAEPDSNEYVYCSCVEELAGIEIPEKAKWIRALQLEMARLQVLLRTVSGQGGTFGLGVGVQWGMYMRDLILDRFEELTGGRVYHMFMIPGGVRGDLPPGFKKRMEEVLRQIEDYIDNIYNLLYHNAVYEKRARGTAVITQDMVDQYGIVGFVARSVGVNRDVRKDYPYLIYDQLEFEPFTTDYSDIYNRSLVRWHDLVLTVDLIRQIMAKMPEKGDFKAPTPNALHWKIPRGETYVRSEASRGEYGMYMVTDGSDKPRRINLRGPSYTHAVALLEDLLVGANIADIHAIMVSLQTCPPEIER